MPKSQADELASPAGTHAAGLDDAVFMPSAVMRVEMPGEKSSAAVPTIAPRRAYAPPKLSQPIPGKVKMTEPASLMVGQWLASIVRALRGMSMYADNNARRKDFVDQAFSVLEDIFAKTMRVDLVITEDHIAYGRDIVHYNPEPFESLPRLLYDGSVRGLSMMRGLTALELVRFIGVISTDFSRPENQGDDLVSIFGRMNLPHIRTKGPETREPERPKFVPAAPEPERLPQPVAPMRLSSAHFSANLAPKPEPEPEPEREPEPAHDLAGDEPEDLNVETRFASREQMINSFANEDDEATVLAHSPPAQKKKLSDLATMDDEATVQDGMQAAKIDVSDLLEEATAQEGTTKPGRE